MTFGYSQPFSFKICAKPVLTVAAVRHGVTEVTLSDGRIVRATLHVKGVETNPKKPGSLDVSYSVVTKVMAAPETPILPVHETLQ